MMGNSVAVYTTLIWIAVACYVGGTILNAWGIFFDRQKLERLGLRAATAGLAVHGAAIAVWWSKTGHGPYMARNEVLISDAWVVMALFLIFVRKYPQLRPASVVVIPSVFLLMALGIMFTPEVHTLTPIFTSVWLIFHISFYKIALATIVIAFACSLFFILKTHTNFAWIARLPELTILDLYAYRFAGFGFLFWAIGMLGGSIWAYKSWGRFWGWDPVETWSLLTWSLFGIYLHLRRFFFWTGERAAWSYMLCFLMSLLALFYSSHSGTSIHSEYFR